MMTGMIKINVLRSALCIGLVWLGLSGSTMAENFSAPDPHMPPQASGEGPFNPSAASVQALTLAGKGSVYAGSFGHGIFRTVDRGANWTPVGAGVSDPFILSLAVTKDGAVYAGTFRGGVFRSRDDGKSWQPVNAGLKRLEVKTLMVAGDELYAGTSDGVYRMNESGTGWAVVTTGLDDVLVHSLARSADGTLYAGTSGKGVLRLKRHTSGWVRLEHGLKDHEGLIENFIRVLVIDQDQSIFAGTFDGGIFRSADAGATWRSISRALPNDSIRGIVLINQGLIAATGNGIFKTLDKGKQWVPVNKGLTNLAIQVLIESGEGGLYAGTSAGVFRSDDGLTWIAVNQGLEAGMAPPPFRFR
jgi:ligand-binding sensor domain-containing protein